MLCLACKCQIFYSFFDMETFVTWHSSWHSMTILLYRLNDDYCIQKQLDGMQDGKHKQGAKQRTNKTCVHVLSTTWLHNHQLKPHCDRLSDLDVTWYRCMSSLISEMSFCGISRSFFLQMTSNICLHRTQEAARSVKTQERNYINEMKMIKYNKIECINI